MMPVEQTGGWMGMMVNHTLFQPRTEAAWRAYVRQRYCEWCDKMHSQQEHDLLMWFKLQLRQEGSQANT